MDWITTVSSTPGRSVNDKFIVKEPSSEGSIWWGPNKDIAPAQFDALHAKMLAYMQGRELYVQDVYAGADSNFRL